MKLVTKELAELFKKYPIGSQDGLGGQAKVIAKFFNPVGVGTWLIIEGSKLENGDYEMFGYCHLGDDEFAELGYVYLSELENLKLPYGLSVERDLYMKKNITLVDAIKVNNFEVPSFLLENDEECKYPLIEKYIAKEEQLSDFCNYFSKEQLDYFERTLNLYFETNDIDYDEKECSLYSKSNTDFCSNIIYLAEGNISYIDFLRNYKESIKELSMSAVIDYFKENNIKDLMEYGSDKDEGLYKLTSLYQEIMEKLNIKYENIYTEDGISDGKYITIVSFENDKEIKIDTSAWNGLKTVAENIESIYNEYEKSKENTIEKINETDIDFDY